MTASTNPSPPRAVIFSYHTVGFGARKASIVFFAEELAKMGWQTDFVTAQLSRLSELAGVPRLKMVPKDQRNVWISLPDGLSAFVWVPAFHPATTGSGLVDRLATPLFAFYPYLLPDSVRRRVRSARLIIIESCSAVMLFPLLKKLAPGAKFLYRACDPLDAIGMHPMLKRAETRTAPEYDLFTSPSEMILAQFPSNVKTSHHPQGLHKTLFDVEVPCPFESEGPHAVVAGDMMFDLESFEIMVKSFPGVTFHAYGRMNLESLRGATNLKHYGEVPFETVRDALLHADLGIAPYLDRPEVHYLAESSLKLVQYSYARLPIVAPYFCKGSREHVSGYIPRDASSIVESVETALRFDRATIDRSTVLDWREVVTKMLGELGLLDAAAGGSSP
jgi:2-beta-glucuronyltransferase